jgi:MFS family permease
VTDIGRPEPPERGRLARIAVDITPLRESRDFRRLWFGTGISAIGSQITTVAIPFQLYDLTGSTLLVGLLGLAALLPLLIVPIYGGAVADAVDRSCLSRRSGSCSLPRRSGPRPTGSSGRHATR